MVLKVFKNSIVKVEKQPVFEEISLLPWKIQKPCCKLKEK